MALIGTPLTIGRYRLISNNIILLYSVKVNGVNWEGQDDASSEGCHGSGVFLKLNLKKDTK